MGKLITYWKEERKEKRKEPTEIQDFKDTNSDYTVDRNIDQCLFIKL